LLARGSRLGLEAPQVQETSRGPDLDLKSWRNVQDPFPLYARLRDHDPVHWSESLNAWVVTRYDDVIEIFNRPQTFSSDRFRKIDERYASQRPAVRAVAEVLGHWLVFRDPPDHDRLRGLLQSSFTPKQLASSRASTASPRAARWTSSGSSPSPFPRPSSPG